MNKCTKSVDAIRKGFFLFMVLGLLVGCQSSPPATDSGNGKIKIVCTTGMIRDAVEKICGDLAQVDELMGPGVDPHLYKATHGDLNKLTNADLIFYNGLHLEGKMGEVLEKLSRQKPVMAVSEGIPPASLLVLDQNTESHDPHLWFDVSLWTQVVKQIAKNLEEQDPGNRAIYANNTLNYLNRLSELNDWVKKSLSLIPADQRIMITAHDAFAYFGRAYNIEVRGLQGISTVAEFGVKDRVELVNFITERKIKAVFVESSVPPKALEAVVGGCARKGHEVVIGGTLFSDAMGASESPEGTYEGMVRWNVNTIVKALK